MKTSSQSGQPRRPHILRELRRTKGHLSGEALSRKLGISRTAVAKHVAALREQGYDIESAPRRGHRLLGVPDRLLPAEIQAHLHTRFIGRRKIVYRTTTGSTNNDAKELAAEGCPGGAVVVAEEQTDGRGRKGRNWVSPPGVGIYASILLRPDMPLADTPMLTLVAAIAAAEAVTAVAGTDVTIKWPNDILLNGRKLAGILTELASEMDAVDYVIVGLGINVNLPKRQLPRKTRYPATSLLAGTGRHFSRAELLAAWLNRFECWYEEVLAARGDRVVRRWGELAQIEGRQVTIHQVSGSIEGRACGINAQGALIVEQPDGTRKRILSGDLVIHD